MQEDVPAGADAEKSVRTVGGAGLSFLRPKETLAATPGEGGRQWVGPGAGADMRDESGMEEGPKLWVKPLFRCSRNDESMEF